MKIEGYLFDTNIFSYLSREAGNLQRQRVEAKMRELPEETPLWLSVISLGEIEYGWRVSGLPRMRVEERLQLESFGILEISNHTATPYAELRELLFNKFSPGPLRSKKRRPEQLINRATSLELGMQENDLWLAAQACERNLILVTGDKMRRIKQIATEIDQLRFEDWTVDE